MKIFYIAVILSCFISDSSNSQPQQEWVRQFNSGSNQNDIVTDMKIDKSGNIYMCGSVEYTSLLKDVLLMKYNSSGDLLWSRTWRGTGVNLNESVGKQILFDSEGFIYVVGTASIAANYLDFLVIKYEPNGDIVWVRTFDGMNDNDDNATSMVLDKNDNVYVTCILSKFSNTDIGVVKYDKDGSLKWFRIFKGRIDNYDGSGTILNDSQNIFVVGGSFKDSINFYDITILKYDTMGLPIDTFYYGSKIREGAGLLAFDSKKNLIVGGGENPGLPTQNNIVTMKITQSGSKLWYEIFNNNFDPYWEDLHDLRVDNKDDILVLARSRNQNLRATFTIIKYNNINGDSAWTRKFNIGPFSHDTPSKISIDKENNIFIIGTSDSNVIFNRFLIVKYNSSGQLQWHKVYYPTLFSNSYGTCISNDTLGNIYASGITNFDQTGGDDIVLIKYSVMTEVSEISNNLPGNFELYQNYPNPFNPETNIRYDLPFGGNVTLKIYDILGKEVFTLINEYKDAGRYITGFNGSDMSSGIYYYTIRAGGFTQTKRLVLLK